MKRLLRIPQRAPWLTIAIVAALTLFFGFFAQSIRVDSSIENLLPEDDPERVYYDSIRAQFGSEEIAVIGVFADDVFAPSTLAKIDRLTQELAAIDGVREAVGLTTIEGVELSDMGLSTGRLLRRLPETPAEAAAFRARVMSNPIYLKNVVSPGGRATAISLVFAPMSDEEFIARGIEGRIRKLVGSFRGPEEFALTGLPTMKVHAARYLVEDTFEFTPLGVALAIAVLVWAFRTVRGVLIPLSTVMVGVVWTMGLMVLAGSRINLGTLVLPPLLMAIGIAYAIHMMSQYYQQLQAGHSGAEVVSATMDHVAVPVSIAALTTLVGFSTFMLTPIPAIREFGMYSVFGIGAIVVASFAVVPAVLTLLPAPREVRAHYDESSWLTRMLGRVGENSVRRRNSVLLSGLLLCALSVWGITRLAVETDYVGFFDPNGVIRTDNARIENALAGTRPMSVIVEGDGPQSVTRLDTLVAMRALQDFMEKEPGVDTTLSVLDYLTLVRRALDPQAPPLPQTQGEIDQLLLLMDPAEMKGVVNKDFSRANIVVRTRLSRSGAVGAFVDRVKAFAAANFPRGVTVRPTGTIVLLSRSADTLAWGQIIGLWQVLAVLFVLMSMMFLSVRVGFLSLIPNILPIIILFGIMGWSGINLNISTSLIAALAVGIAIDDTIHYLNAFNSGLRRTGDQGQAIVDAARSVGRPIVFTSLALAAGFMIVYLSNFKPVQHFGLLSSVTMGVALVCDLFLTPAVLMTTNIVTLWELLFLKLGPEPHKQIPLFRGLRPFQAKIVVLMARLASVPAGAMITRRGEMKEELYVLLSGEAEVRRDDGGVVLRTLGRGDVVGEMGLVRHHTRTADVSAVAAVEYLVLDGGFLRRLPRLYPRIASAVFLNLTRILSDRLESTTDRLAGEGETSPASAAAKG